MSTSGDSNSNSTTLNIPQLALLLLVGFLAVRWILSSNNTPSSSSAHRGGAASRGAGLRVNPRHVDMVASMFPQLSRRDIMWDLQRNGGNVQMTTERVLSGHGLETVCVLLCFTFATYLCDPNVAI
jgi:coupling of ubiquitin conjugation to ER degradation protein 1